MMNSFHRRLVMLAAAILSAGPLYATHSGPASDQRPALTPSIMLEDPTLPGFTLYRPANARSGPRMPILLWANGGCANAGNAYQEFLGEIASHGYFVVSLGPVVQNLPKPDLPTSTAPAGSAPASAPTTAPDHAQPTQPTQLVTALDWVFQQNSSKGGSYERRLDVEHVAAMGHSCGGIQAAWAALHDNRIKTLIFANSGLLDSKVSLIPIDAEDAKRFTLPILYMLGGTSDMAHPVAHHDFPLYDKASVFLAETDVGHGGTFKVARGGLFAEVTLAWLDWQLKGDRSAAKTFVGVQCGLCADPRWTIERHNFQ